MRQRQYTITAQDVQLHARHVFQQHLKLQDHGPKCTALTLLGLLFYAAARVCSLAAACAALRQAPSDQAVHDALLATLPDLLELQRRINRALVGDLPKALRQRRPTLAIDLVPRATHTFTTLNTTLPWLRSHHNCNCVRHNDLCLWRRPARRSLPY